jgi:hypothetical protein
VAIKLEPTNRQTSYLEHEYTILNELQGGVGLPRPLWFGREGSYCAMVLDYLGLSLHKLRQVSPGAFQLHHVVSLGLQIVSFVLPTRNPSDAEL